MGKIIWKGMLTKRLNKTSYWRAIFVIQDAPSSFRLVQEDAFTRLEIEGKMKSVQPFRTWVSESNFESGSAALERAKSALLQSESDGWKLDSFATEG